MFTVEMKAFGHTIRRVWQVGVQRLTGGGVGSIQSQVVPVLAGWGLLLDALLILILFFVVVLLALLLRFPLDLLHLSPLVLEPHLHDSDAESGVLC